MDAEGIKGSREPGGLVVPERRISTPPTISLEAQAFLSNPPNISGATPSDLNDKEAWRSYAAIGNAMLTGMTEMNAQIFPSEVITHRVSATQVFEIVPNGPISSDPECAIFYIHGGAFVTGSGLAAAYMAMPLAGLVGVRTFSVDYRMPPDHPFPVGLDDTVEAYQWLLEKFAPHNIVVVGGSAGGGLAASIVLKARDLGLPMPGACVLATPEADLTESGDTFETNETIDVVLKHRLSDTIALYANGHDLRDPYLSPVFGDFTKGFPDTMLISGTRDLFLSNTVLLHRALLRAGVEAELHVWEAMPHGGFFGAPEDGEVLSEQVRYIRKKLKVG